MPGSLACGSVTEGVVVLSHVTFIVRFEIERVCTYGMDSSFAKSKWLVRSQERFVCSAAVVVVVVEICDASRPLRNPASDRV